MILLTINGEDVEVDVPPEKPLLWVLRDELNMTGTKYSCGIGYCGACTVLLNGHPVKSCRTSVSQAAGYDVITIEGIAKDDKLHPIQEMWIEENVPQCGYCQSGQILSAIALLSEKSNPSDEEIDQAMSNLCRCGTYSRIKKAIRKVALARGAT